MSRLFFTLLLIASAISPECFAGGDSTAVLQDIEHLASKNILMYRIYAGHKKLAENYLGDDGYLRNYQDENSRLTSDISLLKYLPDAGCRLNLEVRKSDLGFPDKNFIVYEIYKGPDRYFCDSFYLEEELPPSINDTRFLVAYNAGTKQILFLSGNFFQSRYSDFFTSCSGMSLRTAIEAYLRFRLFSVDDLEEIRFLRASRRFLYYMLVSKEKRSIVVRLNKVNPEYLIIRSRGRH